MTVILVTAEAIPAEQVRRQFEVNLVGPLAVAGTFLPAMRRRGSGRIVNVSSILGRFALPGTRNRLNTSLLTMLPARLGDRIKTKITSGQPAADTVADSTAVRPRA